MKVAPMEMEDARQSMTFTRKRGFTDRFFIMLFAAEVIMVILYAVFTEYGSAADSRTNTDSSINELYGMWRDVHVMVFLGFGFLMTFLHEYTLSSVGLTFLVGGYAMQLAMLVVPFLHRIFDGDFDTKIQLDIPTLVTGDFGAAAVLISMGGVLGRTSPLQLLVMATVELFAYALNEAILVSEVEVTDIGGSMIIHAFGAYFGVACAWVLGPRNADQTKNGSNRWSDTFAMIGTVFLWMYWPSFNSVLAGDTGNARQRSVINTVLALLGGVAITFALSRALRGRFSMVDVQNASLAGAVAMGASANLITTPWGALTVGAIGAAVSVFGFAKLQGLLQEKFGLYDTCGIHNLHGMPGIVGALAGALFVSLSTSDDYGNGLVAAIPPRADRTAGEQAGFQLLGLGVTLAIAIVSGGLTGLLLKLPFWQPPRKLYVDEDDWEQD